MVLFWGRLAQGADTEEIEVRLEANRPGLDLVAIPPGGTIRDGEWLCTTPCVAALEPGLHDLALLSWNRKVANMRLELLPQERQVTLRAHTGRGWASVAGTALHLVGARFLVQAMHAGNCTSLSSFEDARTQTECRAREARRSQSIALGLSLQTSGTAMLLFSLPSFRRLDRTE
jgi:hypothetical protein